MKTAVLFIVILAIPFCIFAQNNYAQQSLESIFDSELEEVASGYIFYGRPGLA